MANQIECTMLNQEPTLSELGGVPTTRKVNNKPLSSDITLNAADVGAVPTTRTVNSKALSNDITLVASDVGAVPTARTVNSKALSADITLSASDVGALASNGKAVSASSADQLATARTVQTNLASTTAASFNGTANITPGVTGTLPLGNGGTGATTASAALSNLGGVPTSRTVNSKALSSNISLTANDVGALSSSGGTVSGDLKVTGNLTLKGNSNYGNKIVFGDSGSSSSYVSTIISRPAICGLKYPSNPRSNISRTIKTCCAC